MTSILASSLSRPLPIQSLAAHITKPPSILRTLVNASSTTVSLSSRFLSTSKVSHSHRRITDTNHLQCTLKKLPERGPVPGSAIFGNFQSNTVLILGRNDRVYYSANSQSPEKKESSNDKPVRRENIYTLPNILTFSRLAAAPLVGYLVLNNYHGWAAGLFVYAGVTDLIDGYIARKWNCQTVVGTVIDPMADKALMTILTVSLAVQGSLPVWLASIILLRDIGLAISAIYYRWISLPPPKTFARYWDFSLPSAEVHPTTISKYNTALQLALIGITVALPLIPEPHLTQLSPHLTTLQYTVALTTIWSGWSYIGSKDAVKILTPK